MTKENKTDFIISLFVHKMYSMTFEYKFNRESCGRGFFMVKLHPVQQVWSDVQTMWKTSQELILSCKTKC